MQKTRIKSPAPYKSIAEYADSSILRNGMVKMTVYLAPENVRFLINQSKREDRTFSKVVNNYITEIRKGN